jgi:hypothetical protein
MDLGSIFSGLIGILGGVVLTTAIKALWTAFSLSKLTKDKIGKLGNMAGLQAKKYLLDPIKDKDLREIVKKELMEAPNSYDEQWDKGLEGIKI